MLDLQKILCKQYLLVGFHSQSTSIDHIMPDPLFSPSGDIN